MDYGQPIEETARALGKTVTKEMHLDYNTASQELIAKYPVFNFLNKCAPWFVLVMVLVVIYKIFF